MLSIIFFFFLKQCVSFVDKEKVEGEELQKWLKSVVAPAELSVFVQGKQEAVLQLQRVPE